jgi:hypothetical protein
LEALGIFQELNDFPQLFFGFVQVGDIFKGDAGLVLVVAAGTAAGEVEDLLPPNCCRNR